MPETIPPVPVEEVAIPTVTVDMPKPYSEIHPSSIQVVDVIRSRYQNPNVFDKEKAFENIAISTPKKTQLTEEITDLSGAYTEVSPGEFIPKYDTYYQGFNNEDLYARNQSITEQVLYGVGKNTTKALGYVLDGTIGSVVGVAEGLKEGNFNAVWDNSFSKWIDEQNKRLDYQLPNYVSEEEKNMGFLRSMGTANFWANDVLGGVAFMAGAIGSEAIWAAATGGSSLALAGAKYGLRTAGSVAKAGRLVSETGQLATQSAKALKAYSRTIAASNTLGAINNTRFLLTSAGFEAGVEARSSLDESINNFQESVKSSKGRMPTFEEYSAFMPAAVDNANNVFVANMALVGASNTLQFGKFFGVGTGVSENISKALNKNLFGIGLSKSVDGTVAAIKATNLQKGLGKTVAFLRNPVVEGFEEGAQGTVSRMSQNLLASKYDPTAMKENYSTMQALQEALIESFGSREGFKEVGIGMLIGKVGDVGANLRVRGSAGLQEYNKQQAIQESLGEDANKALNQLNIVTQKTIERSLLINQQLAATDKATQANKEGKFTEASQFFDQAQFAKMMADKNAGMLSESVEDFKVVLSKVDNKALAEELAVSESQVEDVKGAMLTEYVNNVKVFEKAYGAAEALQPTLDGLKKQHYIEEVASNFYLGVKAMERSSGLANSIEIAVGQNGFADMLKFYSNMDSKIRNNVFDLKSVNTRIENLEREYAELQQQFSILQETKPRVEENIGHVKRLESNRNKAANVLKRKQLLEDRRRELEADISTNPVSKNYAFGNLFSAEFVEPQDLVKAVEEINKLDEFIVTLEKSDRQAAENLRYLVQEYAKTQKSFEIFHDVYQRLSDPNFNFKRYKGVAKLIANGQRFQKPTGTLTLEEQSLEDKIVASEMDEYEAFNFRLHAKVSEELYKGLEEFTLQDFTEPIEEAEWTDFLENKTTTVDIINSISNKIINNEVLSNRERRIYENLTSEVETSIKNIKKRMGDTLRKALPKPVLNENFATTSQTIRDFISQIMSSKNYLDGINLNDITPESVPTEEDYREINKLENRRLKNGFLSPKLQKRYDSLSEKINAWGAIEGTFTNGQSLGDLYNQLFALEKASAVGIQDEVAGVVVSDVMNADEIEAVQKKVYYNILQSYDKAFFSRSEQGIHIHNINLDGFIQNIVNDVQVEFVKIDGKKIDLTKLTGINFDRNARIEYTNKGGVAKTIAINRGQRGELILSESSLRNLNEDTSIQAGITVKNAKMPSNYFTVLKKVSGDKLVPLSSNFNENDISSDPQKIQKLRKGDVLAIQVDMSDSYNKKLFRDYKKDGDLEKLTRNIKINFVKDDNLVGVLKAQQDNSDLVVNQNHYDKMAKIRIEATNTLLEDPTPGVIELESNVKVERVFMGHPVLNLEQQGNSHVILQNSFNAETSEKITDIGYILDGEMKLKNNSSRDRITESYIHAVLKNKNGKYTGRRVPIVVIDYNGRNIAYPVSLIPEIIDSSYKVDEIINTDLSDSQKAIKINELLMQNGVDVQKLQIRGDNYIVKIEEARRLLANQNKFVNLEEWIEPSTDIATNLIGNAAIDLDLRGDLFHSPKVTLDFGPASQEVNVEKISSELLEEDEMDEEIEEQGRFEEKYSLIELPQDIKNKLAGIKDSDEFSAAIASTNNEDLIIRYTTDPFYAEELFNFYSKMQKIPVMKVENQLIIQDLENDTEDLFKNTLKNRVGNFAITSNYEFLQGISEDVWHDNEKEVKEVLKAITKNAAEVGIDTTELGNKYDDTPQIDVMEFIENLVSITSALNTNVATEEDRARFAQQYNKFFGIQPVEKETTAPSSDLNLVEINTNMDEVELYDKGYIHISDNIYQRIEKDPNIYETLYDMVVQDPSLLPKVAFYPIGYKGSEFAPERIQNPSNKIAVQSSMKRYVQKLASEYATTSTSENKQSLEEIIIFKLAFKHPIITVNQSINTNQQWDNYRAFNGDIVYLTGEFLSDFNTEKMFEKAKDSSFYRNVLRHFEITDQGLKLINPTPEQARQIASNTPNSGIGHSLRQYSIISKDKNINELFDNFEGENLGRSIPFFRNLYKNNITLLTPYKGDKTYDGDVLQIENIVDNFIRIDNDLYEKVGEKGNISQYKIVEGTVNEDFNIINPSIGPGSTNFSVSPSSIASTDKFIEIKTLAKKDEMDGINSELDACS